MRVVRHPLAPWSAVPRSEMAAGEISAAYCASRTSYPGTDAVVMSARGMRVRVRVRCGAVRPARFPCDSRAVWPGVLIARVGYGARACR